jgi:hypothetical protein
MSIAHKTYNESLQEIVEKYREAGERWPTDRKTIAAWAVQQRLWEPSRKSAVSQLAIDLGRAMRDEYLTDPQGRRVRRKHARRIEEELPTGEYKQTTIWDDITTASPVHMHMSLQQRRRMILGDCHQLKTDAESYNENYNPDPNQPIQLSWDFTYDLAEMENPEEYPEYAGDESDA